MQDDGYLLFKPGREYMSYFLEKKDIFLLFKDHRVRYVTIDRIREDKKISILLQEKDVIEEVKHSTNVSLCLASEDIAYLRNRFEDNVINFSVIFAGEEIGKVLDVNNFGAHDNYIIRLNTGKEVMVPDVERYVEDRNSERQELVLINIEELLEL
jgi:ribosomal 30S subunit maturation factor RimM